MRKSRGEEAKEKPLKTPARSWGQSRSKEFANEQNFLRNSLDLGSHPRKQKTVDDNILKEPFQPTLRFSVGMEHCSCNSVEKEVL